jgi:ABC-2 type transport system permease protein
MTDTRSFDSPVSHHGWRAVLKREWQRLRGDFWDVGMLTWIPLVLYGIIWLTFSSGIARNIPIVVVDEDHSTISRQLVRWMDATPGITVAEQVSTTDQAMSVMRERRAYGILLIPRNMSIDLQSGRNVTVQWFYNGQYTSHAGALTKDVRTVVGTLSAGVKLTAMTKRGTSTVQANEQFEPIRTMLVSLFNENTSYESFLAMVLIPSMLQIFVVIAVVTSIGRELRESTVTDWIETAGGNWATALTGKLLIPFIVFTVHALLFVIFFTVIRGWAIEGSTFAVLLSLLLFILAYIGLGLLLIGVTCSMRLALSAAAFITAPAFAYAGQGFPLLAMPALAKIWANILPLTHYLQLQTRHWLGGAPLQYGATQMLILCLCAVVFGGIGFVMLKKLGAQPKSWGKA